MKNSGYTLVEIGLFVCLVLVGVAVLVYLA